jgi:hypothetical protein
MGLKSDHAASLLAQALENNRRLVSLNLSYNGITIRGCKALKDAVAASERSRSTSTSLFHPNSVSFTLLTLNLEGNSGEKKPIGLVQTGGVLSPTSKTAENTGTNTGFTREPQAEG